MKIINVYRTPCYSRAAFAWTSTLLRNIRTQRFGSSPPLDTNNKILLLLDMGSSPNGAPWTSGWILASRTSSPGGQPDTDTHRQTNTKSKTQRHARTNQDKDTHTQPDIQRMRIAQVAEGGENLSVGQRQLVCLTRCYFFYLTRCYFLSHQVLFFVF